MRAASLRILAVAALVGATSCDRGVTAPTASSGAANQTIFLGSPATVNVVRRDTPLAAPLSASATIGILGGQISIPEAGVRVLIPAFALRSSTRITVTAVAGDQVAYEFQPHGIRFLVPLLVSQNLAGTSAYDGGLLSIRKPLIAGYFENLSDLDPLAGTGLVTELLGVALNLSTKTATFPVFHFSGYLVATGENRPESGESQ